MKYIWERIKNEPAYVAELLKLVIPICLAAGWIHWSGEMTGYVMALISFALTGAVVRPQVVSTQKIEDAGISVEGLVQTAKENNVRKTLGVLVPFLLALGLTVSACGAKTAPVVIGEAGLTTAQAIGQIQTGVIQLEQAKVLTPQIALATQERLLDINERLRPLPGILRAIKVAQSQNQSANPLIAQALSIAQAVSSQLNLMVGDIPVSAATKQVLSLIAAIQQSVTTTAAEIAQLRSGGQ